MEVYAFVGPSGTGKSHRALLVAQECGADAIIDDGLLIRENKIVAGRSAKKERSKIQAIRRAIFNDEDHAQEVREAIIRVSPTRILILGTSDNMVNKIVERLEIPPISKIVRIEEVATKREIAKARESRIKEGKHIIPVPTIELKPYFKGYMIDPLKIFLKKTAYRQKNIGEKSVIRPLFSYYGTLSVSDSAVASIVHHVVLEDPIITKAAGVNIRYLGNHEEGISIALEVVMQYGHPIRTVLYKAQQRICDKVEFMTGMSVREVNIDIKRLQMD